MLLLAALLALVPISALLASGETPPTFYRTKLYCNNALVAVGYIEWVGGAEAPPQVYAYPPAATCGFHVIDTAKAILYTLMEGVRHGNIYSLVVSGPLHVSLSVVLYPATPSKLQAVITGLELLAMALIGLALLAIVRREELEIL